MEEMEARRLLGVELVSYNSNNDLLVVVRCQLLLGSLNNGLLVVVRCELLLESCNSNNGHFSFFFEQIKVDFHLLVVLVKTTHLNAHGRDCDVWGDDCFCPIG
ncbi:hypothetical protein ACE6H2_002334 [Prunus campanulata]